MYWKFIIDSYRFFRVISLLCQFINNKRQKSCFIGHLLYARQTGNCFTWLIYWVGQKLYLHLSMLSYRKIWMNFLSNPILCILSLFYRWVHCHFKKLSNKLKIWWLKILRKKIKCRLFLNLRYLLTNISAWKKNRENCRNKKNRHINIK